MGTIFDDLGSIWPVYLIFIASGLIIYAVSTWIGEALLMQIRSNKTSIFGRTSEDTNKNRTFYAPPSLNMKAKEDGKEVQSLKGRYPTLPQRPL